MWGIWPILSRWKKFAKLFWSCLWRIKNFFGQVRIQNFKIFAKSEFWNLENNNFEISKFKIPKNFKIFPKFFQNFKNGAGPKNSLVHPELWVCHFGRFPDLAIFPIFRADLTCDVSQRYYLGVFLEHGTLVASKAGLALTFGWSSLSTFQNGIRFWLFARHVDPWCLRNYS